MINGNDSAYAKAAFSGGGDFFPDADGLTKREYFAAMAMQGLITQGANWHSDRQIVGEVATAFADHLIAALNVAVCPECKQLVTSCGYTKEMGFCPDYERARLEAA